MTCHLYGIHYSLHRIGIPGRLSNWANRGGREGRGFRNAHKVATNVTVLGSQAQRLLRPHGRLVRPRVP
jgi:hypothetical protein